MFTRICRLPAAAVITVLLLPAPSPAQDAGEATAEQDAYAAQLQAIYDALDPQRGTIVLGDELATLEVPDEFYFLDAEDSEAVLVDLWGNPPGQGVLGMLFPSTDSPFDNDAWAVTIEWSGDGYIADDDAAAIDYDELLQGMQTATREANPERVAAGYEPVELLGWAERPTFNADTKKLYWAKLLRFGDAEDTMLNYEIRALGRRGVLSMTFVAAADQLAEINRHRESVLAMAEFSAGSRYQDFDPQIDEVAAYGIGALVAGKIAAKTGFLAGGLLLLKKFGVFLLLGIGALWRRIIGLFKTDSIGPA
ncbi:MAG TPA: DUF2167 domain-containing protein [Woeseiaceae bacterium]|nr:DUF2167 domain-containing protein [Woeseiaceae bacterium]